MTWRCSCGRMSSACARARDSQVEDPTHDELVLARAERFVGHGSLSLDAIRTMTEADDIRETRRGVTK